MITAAPRTGGGRLPQMKVTTHTRSVLLSQKERTSFRTHPPLNFQHVTDTLDG